MAQSGPIQASAAVTADRSIAPTVKSYSASSIAPQLPDPASVWPRSAL